MNSDNNKEIQKKNRKGKTNNPNGRPKGSGNKISGVSIIAAIEKYAGKTYEEQLAQNYAICVAADDRQMIAKYDQMFLNKVVGDLATLELTGEVKQTIINITQAETGQY